LAALEATLLAYRSPDRLTNELPTLRLLTRPLADIAELAERLLPAVSAALGDDWHVEAIDVASQVGSGSLPVDVIPSRALAIRPAQGKGGGRLQGLADRFRMLPMPVIGRIADDAFVLDMRCLTDEAGFAEQLTSLARDV
jgi:L-seryl-tRNA(Ser) seleniumtransferase